MSHTVKPKLNVKFSFATLTPRNRYACTLTNPDIRMRSPRGQIGSFDLRLSSEIFSAAPYRAKAEQGVTSATFHPISIRLERSVDQVSFRQFGAPIL
jgi:hypothetical protein